MYEGIAANIATTEVSIIQTETMLKRLFEFWNRITQPSPKISGQDDRFRSQLAASLALVGMLITGLFAPVYMVQGNQNFSLIYGSAFLLTATATYFLRQVYYQKVVLVIIVIGTLLNIWALYTQDIPQYTALLTVLIAAAFMLPARHVFVIGLIGAVAALVMGGVNEELSEPHFIDQFIILNFVGGMIVVGGVIRERNERVISEQANKLLDFKLEQERLAWKIEKDRILYDVLVNFGHDIRTSLSIFGTSLYLLDKKTDDEFMQRHIGRLGVSFDRMNRIVERVSTVVRMNREGQNNAEVFDANEAIQQFVQQFKHPQLRAQLHASPLWVSLNIQNFHAALLELVNNAFNYSPDDESVIIRTSREESKVVIEVVDKGAGIPPDDLPYIFEFFYKSDKARQMSEEDVSSGLGLNITKTIIDNAGGELTATSQPQRGSTFTIRLPQAHPEHEQTPQALPQL